MHEHHHHEHHHDHHDHHHADEVFVSVGIETARKFTREGIESILESFDEDDSFGMVLRAKGIVEAEDGSWIHFDYVPGESDVRCGSVGMIGRLCVIGSKLDREKIMKLFEV